jgi:hypothetical protein
MDEDRQDEALTGAPNDAAAPPLEAETAPTGGGLRLLAAVVTAPWLVGYGVIGTWAVTRGARAAAGGLSSFDVGYARVVTPAGVILVGALLLAGFAVLLAAAMLVLYDARVRGAWAAVCVAAVILTAGSVWAAVRGDLHPGLWLLFFGGLLYAAALSLIQLVRVTRSARHVILLRP